MRKMELRVPAQDHTYQAACCASVSACRQGFAIALPGTLPETVGGNNAVLGATDKHLAASGNFSHKSCSVHCADPSDAAVFATADLRILKERPLLLSKLKLLESGS